MIGGVVNFSANRPSRLFVSRITAAIGGANEVARCRRSACGAVDESGNLDFRADNNLTTNAGCPTLAVITGNNYFRVRMAARTATLNVLSDSFPTNADAAATDWLLMESTTTHSCPNIVPHSVAGRSILLGATRRSPRPGSYVYESSLSTLTTLCARRALPGASRSPRLGRVLAAQLHAALSRQRERDGSVLGARRVGLDTTSRCGGSTPTADPLAACGRTLPAVVSDPDQAWTQHAAAGDAGLRPLPQLEALPREPVAGRARSVTRPGLLAAAVVYYGGVTNLDPTATSPSRARIRSDGATAWTGRRVDAATSPPDTARTSTRTARR